MKVDTEIRHITKPGTNLFTELGFSAEQAEHFQTASRQQINEQLMSEPADLITAQCHTF